MLTCVLLLQPHKLQPAKLLCPWNFPGKNTGVGCHFFLQGIFLTQGSNLRLLHCRWYPALQVESCIAGGLFTTEPPGKQVNMKMSYLKPQASIIHLTRCPEVCSLATVLVTQQCHQGFRPLIQLL